MGSKTVQDYVNDILYVGSVRSGEGVSLRADLEAYDILDQVATSTYLYPDVALYFFMLSRNALVNEINKELLLADQLISSVRDSLNLTFSLTDYAKLSVANSVMASASSAGAVTGYQLSLFSSSVDKFLNGDVRRNVFQGSSTPRRPGGEAVQSVPYDLKLLKDQHEAVLSRYYALAVCIKNFCSTNFSSVRGPTVLNRIKAGISSTLEDAKSEGSGANSRDIVNRLIAYRSVLESLSSPTNLYDLLLDTTAGVPKGYSVLASSPPTAAEIVGGSGPYTLPTGCTMSLTADESTDTSQFPMTTYDLRNFARIIGKFPSSYSGLGYVVLTLEASPSAGFTEIIGSAATWYNSATIDAISLGLGKYWLKSGNKYTKSFKIDLSSCTDPTSVLSSFRSALGYSSLLPNLVAVVEYPKPSYGKFALIAEPSYVLSMTISSTGSYVHVPTETIARYNDQTDTIPRIEMTSGATSYPGPVEAYLVAESINALFPSKAQAVLGPQGQLRILGVSTEAGASLSISGTTGLTSALGIVTTTALASSPTVLVSGQVNGETQDPLQLPMISVGDVAICPTGTSTIESVSPGVLSLRSSVRTFSGQFGVESLLRSLWSQIQPSIDKGITAWAGSGFGSSLSSIDRNISILIGDPSQASVNSSVQEIESLKASLESMKTSVYPPGTDLPPAYYSYSVSLAKATIQLLSDRKMDRAVDLLLSGRIQEVLLSDANSLSYATRLAKSIEDVAKSELTFTDTAKNDRPRVRGTRREYG